MNFLILVVSVFVLVSSEPKVESSRPAIGHMNTTMSVVCDLVNSPEGNVTKTWIRNSKWNLNEKVISVKMHDLITTRVL